MKKIIFAALTVIFINNLLYLNSASGIEQPAIKAVPFKDVQITDSSGRRASSETGQSRFRVCSRFTEHLTGCLMRRFLRPSLTRL